MLHGRNDLRPLTFLLNTCEMPIDSEESMGGLRFSVGKNILIKIN